MFSPEEMLLLGAACLLIVVLSGVALYNFLVPKRQMDIMSGSDVRIREEDLASPEEARMGTCTKSFVSPAQTMGRLKHERERGFEGEK